MSETVLVTGGAGVVGRRVVAALRARGFRTRCLVHRRPVPGCDEEVRGDLVDVTGLAQAFEGAAYVLHLAAVTHARRTAAYDAVNVGGTRALVEAAAGASSKRIVLASTRAIDPRGGAYSRSKAAAEDEVRRGRLPFTIVRMPEVFGGGGNEGIDAVVRDAARGRPLKIVGHGSHQVCPLIVDDVIDPLVAALTSDAAVGHTYTLAGECLTVRDFAEECLRVFGRESRIVGIPESVVAAAGALSRVLPLPVYPDQLARLRAPKSAATPEARSDLGFAPRPLAAALLDARGR